MAEPRALTRERIVEIARDLPAAPRVLAELGRQLADANTPVERIGEVIKRDAALAAGVIRAGNSVMLGGEQRAGSVEEAVGRIGYREVFRLAGGLAGMQLAERALRNYGLEAAQLREHMLHTAMAAEQVAAAAGLDARSAYTAGLMRPLGLFVCDRAAELYPGVEAYHPTKDRDYLSWEGRLFGVGSADVAALVLEEWKFPAAIVDAIRQHYDPPTGAAGNRLACVLNLASGLVADDGHGLLGETGHWAVSPNRLKTLGINAKQLREAGQRAREAFLDFQGWLTGRPPQAAKPSAGGAMAPDFCDFPVKVRVVQTEKEPSPPSSIAEVTPVTDFTTFMRNYQDMVYSTAVRLIGNETQAEDISQEVFIKAHQHWENLQGSPTAGGWLKTVATNLSINHIQRYKKRWSFFSDLVRRGDEGEEREVEFAAPDTFFSGMDSGERREWVERALEKLPEHQRVPLVLFHFEDMPYDEIARKLRVSLSKVKTDILRGREALAKVLLRSGTEHETFQA